ncbi:hypothetical protein [Acidiphilium acidophilum]|uniref:hypothetical protein n=1 Tax=Acidiphilium acidophilum TaxID=76588 RepID=UPI002E8E6DF9|nr:hypothetical protein [Acidiphilium acidophilum]
MGIGDKRKSDAERQERRRQRLAVDGIKPMTVHFPDQDRSIVRDLSRRVLDGQSIRQVMRELGGSNQPDGNVVPPEVLAELDYVKARLVAIEREAASQLAEIEEAERQRRTLEAERDVARVAEAEERAKVHTTATEAQAATRAAQEAKERTTEALQRAEKAETAIRRARSLPGVRGRLVRWLAGDVLPD